MPGLRLVGIALLAAPIHLGAQDQPRTITQMIVGASAGTGRARPTFLVGFEVRPANTRTSWRVSAEYAEWRTASCITGGCDGFSLQRGYSSLDYSTFGIQASGVRRFRSGRVQPYVFGGVGLYYSSSRGWASPVVIADSGIQLGEPVHVDDARVSPRVLWGTGLSFRVRGISLFGEAALPTWSTSWHSGPQPSLTLGIRF
ncbi:MAG TPA: hypothetical protein VFT29_07025 [Gemmatimonadaceae bacterium]|nr:hypothetical protein [Gemmatimonadaceae bacterium]